MFVPKPHKPTVPLRLRSLVSRQPIFSLVIRLTRLLSRQIVDPFPTRLDLLPFAHGCREIEPTERVAYRAYLVTDGLDSVFAHAFVEGFVGQELVKVFGDGFTVAWFDEKAVFAVLDLEGDTAGLGGYDGDAFVDAVGKVRGLDIFHIRNGKG